MSVQTQVGTGGRETGRCHRDNGQWPAFSPPGCPESSLLSVLPSKGASVKAAQAAF